VLGVCGKPTDRPEFVPLREALGAGVEGGQALKRVPGELKVEGTCLASAS